MDKKRLSRMYFLPIRIDQKKREIQRIQERLTSVSPNLSGMPHGSGVHDKIGEGVVELVTKKEELEQMVHGYQTELDHLEEWVESIEDIQIQTMIELRYKERMTWNQVADEMGTVNTDDSCRKMVERFLAKGSDPDGSKKDDE